MQLEISVEEMSKKITEIYNSDPINEKGIFKSLSSYLLKGDHKTVAIYLYKRELLKLNRSDILSWLANQEDVMHAPLFNSFFIKANNGEYTEISNYIIKNDHISYIYNGKILDNVISHRKQLRAAKNNKS
jgi:hypothetical protein